MFALGVTLYQVACHMTTGSATSIVKGAATGEWRHHRHPYLTDKMLSKIVPNRQALFKHMMGAQGVRWPEQALVPCPPSWKTLISKLVDRSPA